MQSTSSQDVSSARAGQPIPAGADGQRSRVSAGEHAAEYVPSGFPRSGEHGAFPPATTSYPRSSGGVAAHADFGDSARGDATNTAPSHSDSAAAAEWRALYGASAPMLQATADSFRAGTSGVSFMSPIFHLTAHDSAILSMEHNNHCKLLAIATSRNEIMVTWTQLMPVIENMGALRVSEDDVFGGEAGPPMDERLLEWDPATMSILIDELPYTCAELSWAPWQQGIYLAGLCPGHGIRIYRYSHGHWALDDCIRTTESTSCAISKYFTVACACSRGRVELWSRGAAGAATSAAGGGNTAASSSTIGPSSSGGERASSSAVQGSSGSAWVLCRTVTLPPTEEDETHSAANISGGPAAGPRLHDGARGGGGGGGAGATAGRHRPHSILGVGWDESGSLLAVGDQSGAVHVLAVTQEGTRLGDVAFHLAPTDTAGPCRQVTWAPSSGRSFLSLAMVFANCVRIVLFRRPRFMNAAGLPHPGHGGRSVNASAHTTAGGSSSSGGVHSVAALQVLASALVPCEEVAKISWNGTGTRFVTSHLDSSVNIWAVDVRYQSNTPSTGREWDGLDSAERAAHHHGGEEGGGRGGNALSEKRLSLVVSVRRTSSVHPYHAASA